MARATPPLLGQPHLDSTLCVEIVSPSNVKHRKHSHTVVDVNSIGTVRLDASALILQNLNNGSATMSKGLAVQPLTQAHRKGGRLRKHPVRHKGFLTGKKRGRPPKVDRSFWERKFHFPDCSKPPCDGIKVMVPTASAAFKALGVSYVESTSPRRDWPYLNQRAVEEPDTDQFPFFRCSWANCGAELHNLKTLKKHVHNVHIIRLEESEKQCVWLGCVEVERLLDLEGHVVEKHLDALARSLGDGPSTHLSYDESGMQPLAIDPVRYLCRKGVQVTPFATTFGPLDPLPFGAGKQAIKAYYKAHKKVQQDARKETFDQEHSQIRSIEQPQLWTRVH